MPDHDPLIRYRFSMRERQIIEGVREGLTYSEIAVRYGLGYTTVVTYARQVQAKTGLAHLPPRSAIRQLLSQVPAA